MYPYLVESCKAATHRALLSALTATDQVEHYVLNQSFRVPQVWQETFSRIRSVLLYQLFRYITWTEYSNDVLWFFSSSNITFCYKISWNINQFNFQNSFINLGLATGLFLDYLQHHLILTKLRNPKKSLTFQYISSSTCIPLLILRLFSPAKSMVYSHRAWGHCYDLLRAVLWSLGNDFWYFLDMTIL